MASNFYTGSMKTVIDTSTSGKVKSKSTKTNKKSTRKTKIKEAEDTKSSDSKYEFKSMEEMLTLTKTKVNVKNIGKEPWLVDDDVTPRNKFKITVSNENGEIWYSYWDTKEDTEKDTEPTTEDVMKFVCHICKVSETIDDLDSYKKAFNFENVEETTANKAYDGFKEAVKILKTMYKDGAFERLAKLGK